MPFWFLEPRFGTPGGRNRHFLDLVSASSRNKKSFSIGAIEISSDPNKSDFGMLVTYQNLDGRPVPGRISIIQGDLIRSVDGKLWRSLKGEKYNARSKRIQKDATAMSTDCKLRKFINAHKSSNTFKKLEVTEEMSGSPTIIRYYEALFGQSNYENRKANPPHYFMGSFVDLAPIRTRPRRTYDSPQTEFNPEGQHTPYVIKKRLTSKTQAEKFMAFLERAGTSSGLFKSISIKAYGKEPQAPFEIKIALGETSLGLANVGYGVSQALPVLVEMFVRPIRTTLAIQQPEVHLHPRAQATFGELIAELARSDDKKFIVETHSDFTIDRFRLNIRRNGPIPSQLLFFERDGDRNAASSIPIEENGDLSENQPDAYREFFYNESISLLS